MPGARTDAARQALVAAWSGRPLKRGVVGEVRARASASTCATFTAPKPFDQHASIAAARRSVSVSSIERHVAQLGGRRLHERQQVTEYRDAVVAHVQDPQGAVDDRLLTLGRLLVTQKSRLDRHRRYASWFVTQVGYRRARRVAGGKSWQVLVRDGIIAGSARLRATWQKESPVARMPAAEVDVDAALVRRLLTDQHPDLAELPLELANNGWDNVVWRLGEELAVRVPRRAVAAALIENEQRWLPEIAERIRAAVPVALPVPVRVGRPTADCPWSWSVLPWVVGVSAATVPARSRAVVAEPLAAVVRALHVPAPADAPYNAVRADPLTTRDETVRSRLAGGGVPRAEQVEALWTELVATEAWSGPPTWLHGDLHPHNLVLDDDGDLAAAGSDVDGSSPSARSSLGLVAVVDFGDMTAGDPATDLATAWLTFDAPGREVFRGCLDGLYDDATWRRARGWALSMATAMVTMSDDEPVIATVGRESLEQVLAG